jgi:SulP family sulfate permease
MSELTITADRKVRELKPDDFRCDYFRIYNFEGELFFGCAPQFEKMLEQITAGANQEVAVILLRMKRIHNPDAMCLEILQKWVTETRRRGTTILLSGVRPDLQRALSNLGIDKLIGADNIFAESPELYFSTIQAMQRSYEILGNRRCQNCPMQLPGSQWSYEI